MKLQTLLILGCGYVGTQLAKICLQQGIKVKATVRHQTHAKQLQVLGVDARCHEAPNKLDQHWLEDCQGLLDSIPLHYDNHKKPFQTQSQWLPTLLNNMSALQWAGYLSATSVYADSQGKWLNESAPAISRNLRGMARIQAEQAWLSHCNCAEVFRLAGIYGNQRNILTKLFAGQYKSVAWQPAHYANRIHVDDIVTALMAAMQQPQPSRIINLSDDYPCSHAEYASSLAQMIGAPTPILLTPDAAQQQLSASFVDFFRDNKRVSNQKMHQELLTQLKYPSFRDAVPALQAAHANTVTQGL